MPIITPVAISSVVADFVKSRLLDAANNGFNQLILDSSVTYDVPSFQLSDGGGDDCVSGVNLFIGRFELASLQRAGAGKNFPLAILSIAKDDAIQRANLQVTPSTYSGMIIVSLDFWVEYPGSNVPLNGEARFHAIEDALISTFDSPATFSMVSQGIAYNNEISIDQGKMELLNDWLQFIGCTLIFRLTA